MVIAPLHVHLLVVDDDDVDRERVLRLLAGTSLDVDAKEANTGATALQLLREHEFDCVVLDNHLGDANGAELLPAIHRESRRDCPVIMITGAGNEALAVQALQEGAADYLAKYQLSVQTLTRAIRRALDHHRTRRELDELHRHLEQRVEQQAAAIRQSERDLRALLDHTPSAIGYWDHALRNRFGNRAHRTWLGVDPEDMPGRQLRDVVGSERFELLQPHIETVLRGQSRSFEQDFVTPDVGIFRHAQISLHPDIGDDGGVRGFYATVADITAIKQAQARAEELAAFSDAVFHQSPVGLGVFDGDGRCVMSNPALAGLVGGTVQALGGMRLAALFADQPALAEAAQATLADGRPRQIDLDLRSAFGCHVQAASALARVDREGRAHLLLAAQDMREQRRVHADLVAARNVAEDAARTKSAFLANMSHEIRTPMNAIVGLTRLALDEALPPGARDYLDKAQGSALALMGILDDVLDHSKLEAGQLRFEKVPLEIEKVLQRVVDLFAVRIEQKGLEFIVELAADVPQHVNGDALRLTQILNNLVGNAVKFTECGFVHLSVRREGGDAAGASLLRFAVRDSGIGIEPTRQAALFEAFAQGDDSITRRYGGTGLGLAICRRLVSMMDGRIDVHSEPGRGSEFSFTARLEAVDPAADAVAGAGLTGLRVLVIEHNALVAGLLETRLRGWQVEARRAPDLTLALAAIGQARRDGEPFDAALLDWQLPGVDGLLAMQRLREAAGEAQPLCLLAMVNVIGRASRLGGDARRQPDAVLAKPVLASPLLECLRDVRSRHSGREPAPRRSGTPDAAVPGAMERLRERGAPLRGTRILLVEDNELNRLVALGFLQRLGLEVEVAVHGAQAVEMLQSGLTAFDAVLMDLHMPVMDGLEATRRVHAWPATARLPIIGMTAAAMPGDRERCIAAGMVDHVPKPIVPEQLLEVLLRWTGRGLCAARTDLITGLGAFDISTLQLLVHGDQQVVWRLLGAFLEHEADVVSRVQALLAAGDTAAACGKLHELRGSAGNLGAQEIARTALALEQVLRRGDPPGPALADFSAAAEVGFEQLRRAIERRRSAPGGGA